MCAADAGIARRSMILCGLTATLVMIAASDVAAAPPDPAAPATTWPLPKGPGVCVIVGAPSPDALLAHAKSSQGILFVQDDRRETVAALRRAAQAAGLLGTAVVIEHGDLERIGLASNLADGALITARAARRTNRREVNRVLHFGAAAHWPEKPAEVKPRPEGADDWSHPYHGPDNNPQSTDAHAKAPLLTQFLAEPWYVPQPQVTVVSGGRVFKAFGHIALKEREWPWLHKLVCINGFNGALLWKRELEPGYMIHRNTIVATPDILYVADNRACLQIDARTGKTRGRITIPKTIDGGGSWKWMALQGKTLYALIGEREAADPVIRGGREQPGWPWRDLGKGYAGKYRWGFGKTLVALDAETGKTLWVHRSPTPIDGRAICLVKDRLYVYSHPHYLACLDAKGGQPIWKSTDERTLQMIGAHDRAQTASKGFASTAYMKANDKGIYFAGPQRKKLVAVSPINGSLMWDYPHGNFQLVLRKDGLYAMGRTETSKRFDYQSGEVLEDLRCFRGNCTRATGGADSIFTRGYRHTGTMRLDLSGRQARRFPLMRPACQDGVIISDGMFYWGPWMCDCNHSLIGMICMAPAGDLDFDSKALDDERLQTHAKRSQRPNPSGKDDKAPQVTAGDWPGYRGGAARRAHATARIAARVRKLWEHVPPGELEPTAPIAAGRTVFWSGSDGVIRAADANTGNLRWTATTGGGVRFPPAVAGGRLYVGSGDGNVYCQAADTGAPQWTFRAAPHRRRILVHGKLLSTWPVNSGVLVDGGVVYAAAGIASYDGTHVYALDADTGKLRWQNNTSGRLAGREQVSGVSVQGHLLLHQNVLHLAGGNLVSPAKYRLSDGKCLNTIENEWMVGPPDKPFPANPRGTMFRRSPRGRELFVVAGKVRVFDELLYSPPRYGPSRYFGGHFLQAGSEEVMVRATHGKVTRIRPQAAGEKVVGQWQMDTVQNPLALAVCQNVVLVAGEARSSDKKQDGEMRADGKESAAAKEKRPPHHRLWALDLRDGSPLWSQPLPAAPVSWGLCVTRRGNAIVTLADGRVVCFGSSPD